MGRYSVTLRSRAIALLTSQYRARARTQARAHWARAPGGQRPAAVTSKAQFIISFLAGALTGSAVDQSTAPPSVAAINAAASGLICPWAGLVIMPPPSARPDDSVDVFKRGWRNRSSASDRPEREARPSSWSERWPRIRAWKYKFFHLPEWVSHIKPSSWRTEAGNRK